MIECNSQSKEKNLCECCSLCKKQKKIHGDKFAKRKFQKMGGNACIAWSEAALDAALKLSPVLVMDLCLLTLG